jgi:predicted alpha/beta superfamily hydrolase
LQYPASREIYIAGYSLAGLFSMWALYETDILDGAVSCSGSLWYPGWLEYMQQHSLHKEAKVYLSLGKNEEKTKHPEMKLVGDRTRQQYERIRQDTRAKAVTLEWREGGHFSNTIERVSDGIRWMI